MQKPAHENNFTEGMFLDCIPERQPGNTYPFALNAVKSRQGAIENEKGWTAFNNVDSDYYVIGGLTLPEEDSIIFTAPATDAQRSTFPPQIKLMTRDGVMTTVIEDENLGFSLRHPIRSIKYKKTSSGKRLVYFTDKYNPPRFVDLDKDYTGLDLSQALSIFPPADVPTLALYQMHDTGGVLKSGVYQFALRYLDEDLNPTNTITWSGLIPVIDDAMNNTPPSYEVDGCEANTNTSKSIELHLTGLDTFFSYYELYVIKYIDSVETTELINTGSISASSAYYLYTGSESAESASSAELVVSRANYNTAGAMETKDGILVLCDLGKQARDIGYQTYANDIRVTWIASTVADQNVSTGYFDPSGMCTERSFMRDEVYALAIVFLFNDGTESYAYHIPGREKDKETDGTAITSSIALDAWGTGYIDWDSGTVGPGDINNYYGVNKERWEIYNTGFAYTTDLDAGEMSYWESTELYPNDSDTWGSLAGQAVRHHKMPDNTVVPCYYMDGSTRMIRKLGIRVTNVFIPEEIRDITQGFKIVYAPTNQYQTSVIGKGMIFPSQKVTVDGVDKTYPTYPLTVENAFVFTGIVIDNNYTAFFPELMFNGPVLNATELKIEGEFTGTTTVVDYDNIGADQKYTYKCPYNEIALQTTDNVLRKVDGSVYAAGNSNVETGSNFTYDLYNLDGQPCVNFQTDGDPLVLASTNLATLDSTSQPSAGFFGSLKRNVPNQYGSVNSLEYVDTGVGFVGAWSSEMFYIHSAYGYGGDTFIGNIYYRRTTDAAAWTSTDTFFIASVVGHPFESRVNVNYRHGTDEQDSSNNYYRRYYEKWTDLSTFINQPTYVTNAWMYNQDYSKLPDLKKYYAVPLALQESTEDSSAVAWSERSTGTETTDNWRSFPANNYSVLPQSSGPIQSIFASGNALYADTTRSRFRIFGSEGQALNTDESTAFLQSQDLFAIQPQERTNLGRTGPWAGCATPFGYLSVDGDASKIYIVSDGMEEVGMYGIMSFLQRESRIKLRDQLKPYGIDVPDRPLDPNGTGYVCGYDPLEMRILVTKRDYILSAAGLSNFQGEYDSLASYSIGDIVWYDNRLWKFRPMSGYGELASDFPNPVGSLWADELQSTDTTNCTDKSWTLSYDPIKKRWVSFHSLQPCGMWSSSDRLYGVPSTGNNIGYYGSMDYGNYFGINGSFIIESVHNPYQDITKVFDFFEVYTRTVNTSGTNIGDDFFTGIYAYTHNQVTGDIDPTSDAVRKYERFWKINQLRDLVSNAANPIMSYSNAYQQDKVTGNINNSKNWYEQKRLRGLYCIMRLIYDNTSGYNIFLNSVKSTFRKSY